jgi:long-chain acyl-CoA synthetase
MRQVDHGPAARQPARSAPGVKGMAVSFSNLIELCDRTCREHGTRPLFGVKIDGSWWWVAYAEFLPLVDAFRGGLASLGVAAGDAVGIVAGNRFEWAVACYGTLGCGAAFVPISEGQTEQEWHFILADCGARVVIGATDAITAKLRHVQPAIPTLAHVVGLELPVTDPRSYAALLDVGRRHPVPARSAAPGDPASIIYVPGTPGAPKGVVLSHGNILSIVEAMHELFALSPDTRSLALLPWAQAFGQICELHTLLAIGGSTAINDDQRNVAANMAAVQPTVLFAMPALLNQLYHIIRSQVASRFGIAQRFLGTRIAESAGGLLARRLQERIRQRLGGRLRFVVCGGQTLAQQVSDRFEGLGITIYEGYGTPETGSLAAANSPGRRRAGSVGKAIPLVAVEIDRDVTGDALRGEVIVRGPNVMQGYYNRAGESAAVRTADGGLRTGDIGYLDGDGYLIITGRLGEPHGSRQTAVGSSRTQTTSGVDVSSG